jgi:hypothetical protein
MGIEDAAEQRGPDGVAHGAALLGLEFKIRFVRPDLHGLAATVELKGPCAGHNPRLELELSGQPRTDGRDALDRLVAHAFVGHEGCGEAADRDGRFIDDVEHCENDILVVVVNFQADGHQPGVEGAGTGAVVVAHHGSPDATEGWLYFNGLLVKEQNQRKRSRVSEGKDQSTAATVWWTTSTLVRYSFAFELALNASRRPNHKGPTTGSM